VVVALLNAGEMETIIAALQARKEEIVMPACLAIAKTLPTDDALALLDQIRQSVGREWHYSLGYQFAVAQSYGEVFWRCAGQGAAAMAGRVLDRAAAPETESLVRDLRAVFSGVGVAGDRLEAAGDADALSLARVGTLAEGAELERRLADAVVAAYRTYPTVSVDAIAAMGRITADGRALIRAAETVGERFRAEGVPAQGLNMDTLLGLRLAARRGLFRAVEAREEYVGCVQRLVERLTGDNELRLWLQLVRGIEDRRLLPCVDRAIARIKQEPQLLGAGEMLSLAQATRASLVGE
jgi:hypothetical protein